MTIAWWSAFATDEWGWVVLQIWDGKIDLPADDGAPMAPDIPCNLVSLLKVRENRLEWTQVMRSNDIFRGIPYDFVQFTCLQEIFASWLGVGLGSYCHVSDSLHAYAKDLDDILKATVSGKGCVKRSPLEHVAIPENAPPTRSL